MTRNLLLREEVRGSRRVRGAEETRRQLVTVADLELPVDLLEVGLDGRRTNREPKRNLLIRKPLEDQAHHLPLSAGEMMIPVVVEPGSRSHI